MLRRLTILLLIVGCVFGDTIVVVKNMINRKDKDGAEIDERQIYARDRLWKTFSTYAKTKDKKAWREFKKVIEEFKKELKKIQLK